MDTNGIFFRANVGAAIINQSGEILVFERADVKGAWQMPQGGLEPNELPLDAVLREIKEETAIPPEKLQLLAEASEWLAYELPEQYRTSKTGRGQVQKWFLFRFIGTDEDIQPDQTEFNAWQWVEAPVLLQSTVSFRRPIYQRLLYEFESFFNKSSNGTSPSQAGS